MRQQQKVNTLTLTSNDTRLYCRQLLREISCLEFQLERLRRREDCLDSATLSTYEEMIRTRRNMLADL
ncbi:MAG: hypothetical protein ACI93R_001802 [Flavobacteriales bacterium]|jgi:hypothetical protein